jgi:hypothetical protein
MIYHQGEGYTKILGEGYKIVDCEGVDLQDSENLKILEGIVTPAKKIRGDVISKSLEIEFYLNEIIGLFFMGDNKKQRDVFNECILQKEFFTFGQKVKVLNFLLTNCSEKFHINSTNDRKAIITLIQNVMERRNKFAHEEIIVNFKERTASIFDNEHNNLLSPQSLLEFEQQITDFSITQMRLEVNLMIEITKQ